MIFVRLEKTVDPVELVHRLCAEAQANPATKKSRYVKRMTPVTEVRKTLSVDLEAFAREILKPHFHSGGPPKKVSNDYDDYSSSFVGPCTVAGIIRDPAY